MEQTLIPASMIHLYVANGLIGAPPLKNGNPGYVIAGCYKLLVGVFETFVLTDQLNEDVQSTQNKLIHKVNAVVIAIRDNCKREKLLTHLLKSMAMSLDAGHVEKCE